ncbi:hypothetical protein TNCT_481461 [Trichonephila clavata]|uniref:Uncharacterized protein n=1 Tax=Trichonephila clavata TaxID=2740835 RepID=A0A8X6F2F1_TRICU|nr:hypothetical protein TNCT_481461 [Trichonephila clavata]
MAFLTPSGVRRNPEVSGLSNKPLSEPPALYFISSCNFLQEPTEKRSLERSEELDDSETVLQSKRCARV